MILACDFDRTIHDTDNPLPGRRMGAPLLDAPEALQNLYDAGHTIIIHTLMATSDSGAQAVRDWMDYYGLPYHDVTAIKPKADWYIDDRAVHHTDWATTLSTIGFIPE